MKPTEQSLRVVARAFEKRHEHMLPRPEAAAAINAQKAALLEAYKAGRDVEVSFQDDPFAFLVKKAQTIKSEADFTAEEQAVICAMFVVLVADGVLV
jgi:hypothetical protein